MSVCGDDAIVDYGRLSDTKLQNSGGGGGSALKSTPAATKTLPMFVVMRW